MLMSKSNPTRSSAVEKTPPVDNWLGRRFFETRRMREEEAASKIKATRSQSVSLKQSRQRIKAANEHRAALLLAAETADYKAAFDVIVRRPAKKSSAAAEAPIARIDRKDPSTWQRPNLDKLKASILEDWKSNAAA